MARTPLPTPGLGTTETAGPATAARRSRRSRSPRGHGGDLRQELLQAGISLLGRAADEQAVTVRGVARIVGVAAPSVYDHFADRDELIRAIVSEVFQRFRATVLAAVKAHGAPADRLRATAEATLQFALANPGHYRILFARLEPSAIPEVGEAAAELWTLLEGELRAAIPEPLTPEALRERAIWMWVELHGLTLLRGSHPRFPWPHDAHLASQILHRAGAVASPADAAAHLAVTGATQ